VLTVENLRVAYGDTVALDGLSFNINRGEVYALVGESGCGKTTAALAVMRYLPRNGRVVSGSIELDGDDVLALEGEALRQVRGRRMSMVYQNPASALNPSMRVGDQVAEVFSAHAQIQPGAARERTLDLLRQVHLPRAEYLYDRYPHQLSGGMQQRIVIAIALASGPRLLVLDEPTTGLDATVEAGVLELIAELQRALGMAILFITHNLSIVARMSERVGVLYAGRLVEEGSTAEVFAEPAHPYTRALLACAPRLGARRGVAPLRPIPGQVPARGTRSPGCVFAPRCEFRQSMCVESEPPLFGVPNRAGASRCYFVGDVLRAPSERVAVTPIPMAAAIEHETLLEVKNARKTFRAGGSGTVALDGVSMSIGKGETLGLVGESGSGKSTLARAIAGLERLDDGSMSLDGASLNRPAERRPRDLLRRLQMVFQDPESTLNPAHTVGTILDRSLKRLTHLGQAGRRQRLTDLLRAVQLDPGLLAAHPAELSGGQKQRVAIARAFAAEPALVLCDEPVSALDVSVQAAILNLLDSLQQSAAAVSYLFISHDIAVVRYLADHVGVLYGGHLVELGPADDVFEPPHHPYTALLLSASAVPNELEGPTSAAGCVFKARCPRYLGAICDMVTPPWRETPGGSQIRCHIPLDELG
jgi:peptide/nickel transport system ATP-binding protein